MEKKKLNATQRRHDLGHKKKKNPKESTHTKQLGLKKFSKVVRYKINKQKPMIFVYQVI